MNAQGWTVPVGRTLLGRWLNADGDVVDEMGPVTDAPRVPVIQSISATGGLSVPDQMLETGIKVVDLMVPMARGGTMSLVGPYGVGKLVLVSELVRNMTVGRRGCAVFVSVEERPGELHELMLAFREAGVANHFVFVYAQVGDPTEARGRSLWTGLTLAQYFRDREGLDVLLIVDERVLNGEPRDLKQWGGTTGNGAITTVLVAGATSSAEPGDSQIVMSRGLFDQQIYPAVDPVQSRSRLLDTGAGGETHVQVARQVRAILQRAQALRDSLEHQDRERLSAEDRQLITRACRIQFFFTQPFFTAQLYTGIPGEYVTVEETVKGVKGLLEGHYDEVSEEMFRLIGSIDQAVRKTKS
ncbi:MAG: hypothetical protein HY710_17210 [Candidatus Latescibacteria bacterium]|nr:hypothetical protein [Candidatus Latescibacterota bacterium]